MRVVCKSFIYNLIAVCLQGFASVIGVDSGHKTEIELDNIIESSEDDLKVPFMVCVMINPSNVLSHHNAYICQHYEYS